MKKGEETRNEAGGEEAQTAAESFDDNVLVISEVRNAVVLPYSVQKLQRILPDEPECADLRALIEKRYTVPLSRYKHGCVSRWKEAYALVREREKGSVAEAIDLASELFFKRFLHPAVITACKNLDWLDVYLDCLDKNELDEFPFFRIRYELRAPKNKRKTAD